MKRILAAAAMLAVCSANASDVKFGDLNYFLKQSQFNLTADVNIEREANGPVSSKDVVHGQYLDTKFGYGIMDNLNVFIALSYNFDAEVDPSGEGRHQADGLQNPNFGANFRVMNQGNSGFNLDVGAVVHWNLQELEVGDSADEGNTVDPVLSDRTQVRKNIELNARLGNKWNEANEFYLLAGIVHNLESEYKDISNGTKDDVTYESSTDFKLGANYQYRPVNEFMMTVGITATKYSEFDAELGNSDAEVDGHLDFDFDFVAKYLVQENIIVKFNYQQGRNSDYDVMVGTTKQEIEKRREHLWGFGVDWLF